MRIVQEGPESLADYATVPIAFEIRSRLRLTEDGSLVETQVEPRTKDYDSELSERPTAHALIQNLGIFSAFVGKERVGGIMIARDLEDFEIVAGLPGIAVVLDLRVARSLRGQGVGRALFERATKWAIERACCEIRVETQDVNVAACRFYERMSCELMRFEEGAYGPMIDEARLIWRRRL